MVKGEDFDFPLPETLNLGSYFLDVNLEAGRADKIAIYHKERTYTFRELWLLTNRIGNVLRTLGVEPENRVLLIRSSSSASSSRPSSDSPSSFWIAFSCSFR